jgi:hypothetical protein
LWGWFALDGGKGLVWKQRPHVWWW